MGERRCRSSTREHCSAWVSGDGAGRRTDAREPLRDALTIFDELGARPWAERARSELRASGRTVTEEGTTRLGDLLTAHESRVALAVARGATNRALRHKTNPLSLPGERDAMRALVRNLDHDVTG
jgi:hypothetical protein